MLIAILSASIALQFGAAYLALRLTRQTGWWLAWMLLAGAMVLMGLRRCVSLYLLLQTGMTPVSGQELIALAISVLMATGVALIGPALANGRRAQETLKKQKASADEQLQQEIHERKWAEQLLRILDRAVASASNGILITDSTQPDNPIIYVNPAFEEITGYARQDVLGHNCRFLQGTDRDQEGLVELRAALIEGRQCRVVLRNYKKDGALFWNELTISPVRDEQGRLTHFIGIHNDITKRRRAEERAWRFQAELAHRERLSLAGAMASGLAHELNQPLTVITTYSEACLQRLKTAGVQADELIPLIEQIGAQGLRAGEIIRRLRDLMLKRELKRSVIEVNALIQEVAGFMEIEAKRRAVTLRLDLAEALPAVYVDHIQIQQVLLNLALNGIEALADAESGSRELQIRTALAEDGRIEVSVYDTGPGLSEQSIERLFQPFFTTKPQGMGLGLSISKSIIEAHDGRLWATTQPDQGTTFHFTLPVVQEAVQQARA